MSCNQDILFITYYYYMMDFNPIIIASLFGKSFKGFNGNSLKLLFMQPCSVGMGTYQFLWTVRAFPSAQASKDGT